jgi:hypothetical protein
VLVAPAGWSPDTNATTPSARYWSGLIKTFLDAMAPPAPKRQDPPPRTPQDPLP